VPASSGYSMEICASIVLPFNSLVLCWGSILHNLYDFFLWRYSSHSSVCLESQKRQSIGPSRTQNMCFTVDFLQHHRHQSLFSESSHFCIAVSSVASACCTKDVCRTCPAVASKLLFGNQSSMAKYSTL
jgi:hypothetical protein